MLPTLRLGIHHVAGRRVVGIFHGSIRKTDSTRQDFITDIFDFVVGGQRILWLGHLTAIHQDMRCTDVALGTSQHLFFQFLGHLFVDKELLCRLVLILFQLHLKLAGSVELQQLTLLHLHLEIDEKVQVLAEVFFRSSGKVVILPVCLRKFIHRDRVITNGHQNVALVLRLKAPNCSNQNEGQNHSLHYQHFK